MRPDALGVRGLTSPVGWGQGKFTIFKDKLGERRAINGFGNRNLLEGLSREIKSRLGSGLTLRQRGDVTPESLLDLANTLRREALDDASGNKNEEKNR